MFCSKCAIEKRAGMSGQGFTKFECEKCGQTGFWHNTNVPRYCLTCSENNLLCSHCGKDMILEMIECLKSKMSLYEIALEIGISETSLYKYANTGSVGPRIQKKLKEFTMKYLEEKGGF